MTVLFFIAFIANFLAGLCAETTFLSVTWGMASGIWFINFLNQLEKRRKNNG